MAVDQLDAGGAGPGAPSPFGAQVLASLFGAMPDGVAYCRMEYEAGVAHDCRVLYANPAFYTLTGLSDAVGKHLSELFPGGSYPSPESMATFVRTVEQGDASTYERYLPQLDKWFSVSVYRPNPGHFVMVFSDASGRFALEAQAERYAEWILNSVGEGLCRVDEAGVVTYINPMGAELLGYQPEEMLGKVAHTLFHHSHADGRPYPLEACRGKAALQQNRPHSVDSEVFWRKDGTCFAVHYVSAPMRVDGALRGTVVTFRDIGEEVAIRNALMESETKLVHLNATLESRVLERTRELVSALDSAELAKRSRGAFLANMSHEIRTPMNTVMGMVHLALKTQPGQPMRGYLDKIQQSGAHLLTMINDILDFSKIDAGKLQLENDDFRVEEMLQHIIQLTEGRAIEKGLSLRLELDPAVPHFVRGDALRLSQILINYLNNAIKFTEHGGIVLRVREWPKASQHPSGGHCQLRFEVQDTGIGLDEDQGARLFKSFEQGDNSTTRKFGGTGLGLAISRQLANLMAGEVGVSSTQGAGSTFWLQVRLEVAAEPDYESIPSPDVEGAIQSLRGRRVLVVDDNDLNLDVARGLLQDVSVQVEVARDGAEAIEAVQSTPFDCVLMDVQMPGMDGLEATRRIRSTPSLAHLVVIAMTANAGQEDRALCLGAGMNEVVLKPVEPDVLYVTLAKWISAAQQPHEAEHVARAAASMSANPTPAAPTPDPNTLVEWDASALARIVGNNTAAHARLLGKYQTSAREIVSGMQLCVVREQWPQSADLAHKLKSSSRSVGAMRLGALCEALEHAGRSGNGGACVALVQSVTAAFAVVDARIGE